MDHKKSGRDRWEMALYVVTRFRRIDELVETAFAATETDPTAGGETRSGKAKTNMDMRT